ncbi:DUF2975 domain-containing protein [Kordiimonas sp.]|uniref:DUF2975 domain-containing protein n=1 Tax=Kordiimonas sp. TaxID=1970157 RepID=UPI003A951E63
MNIPSLIAFRWVIYLSVIVVIAPVLWMWADPASFTYISKNALVEQYGGFGRLLPWQRMAGLIVTLVPALIFAWALVCLLPLIGMAERGDWFNAASERYCFRAGRLLLWHALVRWLSDTALVLVITLNNQPGERALMISFGSEDLLSLIPALMALCIAQMMRVGRAQREELNEIV